MQLRDIRNLFEYNDWANEVLIAMLVSALGEDTDLRSASTPIVKEIQETATHILGALTIWRTRWEGSSPSGMLDPALYPSPRSLQEAFQSGSHAFWTFFGGIESDDRLFSVIAYTNTRGDAFELPLVAMMQHVVNHSTYHRGQITARLMALGHGDVIQSTDFTTWTMLKAQR
ncbi:MAG TPA: DinB family protein [Chthonomonadaceae bacterium]|nr:DinB family protein [Chthonomonadaceae bacterium]